MEDVSKVTLKNKTPLHKDEGLKGYRVPQEHQRERRWNMELIEDSK